MTKEETNVILLFPKEAQRRTLIEQVIVSFLVKVKATEDFIGNLEEKEKMFALQLLDKESERILGYKLGMNI